MNHTTKTEQITLNSLLHFWICKLLNQTINVFREIDKRVGEVGGLNLEFTSQSLMDDITH